MKPKRVTVLISIVLCSAGLALAQTEWVDHPQSPVIEFGDIGSWAPGGALVSSVVFDGTTYHMWFSGTDEGWSINDTGVGHATSPDGVDWIMDPANPVLTKGIGGEWDDNGVICGTVIHDGTEFHMWYTGLSEGPQNIGYATSPDGTVWTKSNGNPVMEAGPPGSWDDSEMGASTVILDGETYKMWYWAFGGTPSHGRIGYADSNDGIYWIKRLEPVLEPGENFGAWDAANLWGTSVVFDGSAYHMWFAGDLPYVATKVGYAFSNDGIEWIRHRDNPVVQVNDENIWGGTPVLFDGSTWHMWYSHEDGMAPADFTVSYATSECCPIVAGLTHMRFIPAAAVASGAQGSFFQTDVDVSNAGSDPAEYLFKWLPRGQDNNDPLTSEIFSLGANMSVRYTNVLSEVFGLEPNSLGALLVLSTSPDLLFMSRTYNAPSAKAGGTYGQAIPAVSYEDLIRIGERKRIVFGSENVDFRFNVGCQNGSGDAAMIFIELFAADGTSLATEIMPLEAWGNDQLNRIFEDHQPVNGCVDVWTPASNSLFYCYGSLLDNVTSDPTTIPPQ